MGLTQRAVAVAGLVAISWGPSLASAAAVDDRQRAQQLLTDGASLFDQGIYDKALDRFQAAFTIFPNPKILYDMAQCEMPLLRPTEAARHFRLFLDATAADPAPANADSRHTARERLGKLEAQLGRLYVSVTPPTAQRFLDGHSIEEPLQYVLAAPTTHTFTATARGYQPSTEVVSVAAGQLEDLTVTLEHDTTLAPTTAAATPPPLLSSPAPAAPSEPNRLPAYLTGAGAVVVAAGALTMGLITQGEYNALPVNYSGHTTPAESNVTTHARITDVLWAASLVTAGVGAVLYFSAAPSPGGGGAVAVSGSF